MQKSPLSAEPVKPHPSDLWMDSFAKKVFQLMLSCCVDMQMRSSGRWDRTSPLRLGSKWSSGAEECHAGTVAPIEHTERVLKLAQIAFDLAPMTVHLDADRKRL